MRGLQLFRRSGRVVSQTSLFHTKVQKQEEIKSPEPGDTSKPSLTGYAPYAPGGGCVVTAHYCFIWLPFLMGGSGDQRTELNLQSNMEG